MKKILIILAATMFFAACDKIAPDDYTTSVGGDGDEWRNANVRRVYVEKYTGPKCPNCPAADVTLTAAHERFGDRLVIISVNHPTGQGEPFAGEPDMRTDAGNAWDSHFGINAIPAAYIDRNTATQYSGGMSNIIADIESTLKQSPQVGVELTATADGNTISITADVTLFSQIAGGLTLTLALTEDSLSYRQINGSEIEDNYVHNHMLRAVITDTWGNDIPVDGNAGEHVIGTFSHTLGDGDIDNLANCHIVALVSRKSDMRVLNSAECSIAGE